VGPRGDFRKENLKPAEDDSVRRSGQVKEDNEPLVTRREEGFKQAGPPGFPSIPQHVTPNKDSVILSAKGSSPGELSKTKIGAGTNLNDQTNPDSPSVQGSSKPIKLNVDTEPTLKSLALHRLAGYLAQKHYIEYFKEMPEEELLKLATTNHFEKEVDVILGGQWFKNWASAHTNSVYGNSKPNELSRFDRVAVLKHIEPQLYKKYYIEFFKQLDDAFLSELYNSPSFIVRLIHIQNLDIFNAWDANFSRDRGGTRVHSEQAQVNNTIIVGNSDPVKVEQECQVAGNVPANGHPAVQKIAVPSPKLITNPVLEASTPEVNNKGNSKPNELSRTGSSKPIELSQPNVLDADCLIKLEADPVPFGGSPVAEESNSAEILIESEEDETSDPVADLNKVKNTKIAPYFLPAGEKYLPKVTTKDYVDPLGLRVPAGHFRLELRGHTSVIVKGPFLRAYLEASKVFGFRVKEQELPRHTHIIKLQRIEARTVSFDETIRVKYLYPFKGEELTPASTKGSSKPNELSIDNKDLLVPANTETKEAILIETEGVKEGKPVDKSTEPEQIRINSNEPVNKDIGETGGIPAVISSLPIVVLDVIKPKAESIMDVGTAELTGVLVPKPVIIYLKPKITYREFAASSGLRSTTIFTTLTRKDSGNSSKESDPVIVRGTGESSGNSSKEPDPVSVPSTDFVEIAGSSKPKEELSSYEELAQAKERFEASIAQNYTSMKGVAGSSKPKEKLSETAPWRRIDSEVIKRMERLIRFDIENSLVRFAAFVLRPQLKGIHTIQRLHTDYTTDIFNRRITDKTDRSRVQRVGGTYAYSQDGDYSFVLLLTGGFKEIFKVRPISRKSECTYKKCSKLVTFGCPCKFIRSKWITTYEDYVPFGAVVGAYAEFGWDHALQYLTSEIRLPSTPTEVPFFVNALDGVPNRLGTNFNKYTEALICGYEKRIVYANLHLGEGEWKILTRLFEKQTLQQRRATRLVAHLQGIDYIADDLAERSIDDTWYWYSTTRFQLLNSRHLIQFREPKVKLRQRKWRIVNPGCLQEINKWVPTLVPLCIKFGAEENHVQKPEENITVDKLHESSPMVINTPSQIGNLILSAQATPFVTCDRVENVGFTSTPVLPENKKEFLELIADASALSNLTEGRESTVEVEVTRRDHFRERTSCNEPFVLKKPAQTSSNDPIMVEHLNDGEIPRTMGDFIPPPKCDESLSFAHSVQSPEEVDIYYPNFDCSAFAAQAIYSNSCPDILISVDPFVENDNKLDSNLPSYETFLSSDEVVASIKRQAALDEKNYREKMKVQSLERAKLRLPTPKVSSGTRKERLMFGAHADSITFKRLLQTHARPLDEADMLKPNSKIGSSKPKELNDKDIKGSSKPIELNAIDVTGNTVTVDREVVKPIQKCVQCYLPLDYCACSTLVCKCKCGCLWEDGELLKCRCIVRCKCEACTEALDEAEEGDSSDEEEETYIYKVFLDEKKDCFKAVCKFYGIRATNFLPDIIGVCSYASGFDLYIGHGDLDIIPQVVGQHIRLLIREDLGTIILKPKMYRKPTAIEVFGQDFSSAITQEIEDGYDGMEQNESAPRSTSNAAKRNARRRNARLLKNLDAMDRYSSTLPLSLREEAMFHNKMYFTKFKEAHFLSQRNRLPYFGWGGAGANALMRRFADIFVDAPKIEKFEIEEPSGLSDHIQLTDFLINPLIVDSNQPLNVYSGVIPNNIPRDSLNLKPEKYLVPINKLGNFDKGKIQFRAHNVGSGVQLHAKNKLQVLNAAIKRYNNLENTPKQLDEEGKQLARDMVHNYAQRFKKDVFHDDTIFDEIWHKMEQDSLLRKYHERYVGQDVDNGMNWNHVLFTMKTAFKPANNTKGFEPGAVGQGVSAMGLGPLCFAMFYQRYAYYMDMLSDRKDDAVYVTTDHGVSQDEFVVEMSTRLSQLKQYSAQVTVFDMVKADSGNTEFDNYLNDYYDEFVLGIHPDMISEYRQYRIQCEIRGGEFSCRNERELLSGESGTKRVNEVNGKVRLGWLCTGTGPLLQIYKGDDSSQVQCGSGMDETRLDQITKYSNIGLTHVTDDACDFLGYLFVDGLFVPNIMRLLHKVTCYPARKWENFQEYQISLKQTLDFCKQVGVGNCIAAACLNVDYHDPPSYNEMEMVWYCVEAWANASKEEWLRNTREFTYEPLIPIESSNFDKDYDLPPTLGTSDPWINWYKDSFIGKNDK